MTDYGIELEDNAISIANQSITRKLIISNLLTLLIFILITILIVKIYQYHKARSINQLLNYLKEINNKNYTLYIDTNKEDEYPVLLKEALMQYYGDDE